MSVMFKVTKVGHSMNVCEHIHTMSNFGHFGHFGHIGHVGHLGQFGHIEHFGYFDQRNLLYNRIFHN